MATTWKLIWTLVRNGVSAVLAEKSLTGDGEAVFEVAIPTASTDTAVSFPIDLSQCAGILFVSDQAVTLETNSGGSPTDTINLAANVPYVWCTGAPFVNKVTADVTATIYVTNASGSTANIKGYKLVSDSTP